MASRNRRHSAAVGALALVALIGSAVHAAADEPSAPTDSHVTNSVMLNPTTDTPVPTTNGLQLALAGPLGDAALGPDVKAIVIDAQTGQQLWNQNADQPATPASTTKVVTAASALSALGADATLTTRVLASPDNATITLVGGGDPLLAVKGKKREGIPTASLSSLAKQTATALKAHSVTNVTVTYDDSMFGGPATDPQWEAGYISGALITPITALMADRGFIGGTPNSDPSLATTKAFVGRLKANGIGVSADVVKAAPVDGASQLAAVSSSPLSLIVQQMLEHSDNTTAETLAHLAGWKRYGTGTFDTGTQAAKQTLQDLSINDAGLALSDGSGLARSDRIPPRILGELISAAARNVNPNLWALPAGDPVAGFSGTLNDRFIASADKVGRGMVRAKTGTLTGVSALAGTAVDSQGRLLAFAFMASAVPNVFTAEAALDVAATALVKCGCQ